MGTQKRAIHGRSGPVGRSYCVSFIDRAARKQGSAVLAAGAVYIVFISSHLAIFSLFPLFWEATQYRLKYCLKEPLNTKQQAKYRVIGAK